MKSLKESLLDDPQIIMDKMDIGAVVSEYNAWLHRNSTMVNQKITDKNVQIIDGEVIVEHPNTMIDIRELPPFRVVLKRTDDIHASIGTNRFSNKAGVTLSQQMQVLRKIIEDSNGYEIAEFRLNNRVHGEKELDSMLFTQLGPIEIKRAVMYTGEATVKLPYMWRCKTLEIQCEGHGDVYMNGMPVGVASLKISRK